MNTINLVLVLLTGWVVGTTLIALWWVIVKQQMLIDTMTKELARQNIMEMAVDVSEEMKETTPMIGPALVREVAEIGKPIVPEEESAPKERTGVTLKEL